MYLNDLAFSPRFDVPFEDTILMWKPEVNHSLESRHRTPNENIWALYSSSFT